MKVAEYDRAPTKQANANTESRAYLRHGRQRIAKKSSARCCCVASTIATIAPSTTVARSVALCTGAHSQSCNATSMPCNVSDVVALNSSQPKKTMDIVQSQPTARPKEVCGEFGTRSMRQAASAQPCRAPQATKFHEAPCHSPPSDIVISRLRVVEPVPPRLP